VIQFGVVLLFCNAPFVSANSAFVIIRTGYKKWFAGQILYVFFASFLYTSFVFLSTVISVLPNLTFEKNWGKVFATLAQTSHDVPFNFEYGMHLKYDVSGAIVHTMLLLFLFSFMLGMLIFLLNSFINKASGMIASTSIILFSFAADWSTWNPISIIRISPSSLTALMNLDNKGFSEYPSLNYAYMALLSMSALFIILTFIVIMTKTKSYKHFKENMGGWIND
jgi:hypothetical protein